MKKPPRLGLLVEGRLTSSAFLRSPGILSHLGPVKAKSQRVARRATNFLRAGIPTDSYEAFEDVQVILIHVPAHCADARNRRARARSHHACGEAVRLM